uniref:Uncharacterized protein n=1 Tax=Chrysotila carterae TaxID=13221 RepID=A0A7S4BXA4_CHRCT
MRDLILPTARFSPVQRIHANQKAILFDVMDTLVADPFFRGFHADLFGFSSVKQLFEVKDQQSFLAFESGAITEDEHFATYFCDRRPVDGAKIRSYLSSRYEWKEGMKELCIELRDAGILMAAFSNYPAQWAPLVEDAVALSTCVPWGYISGERGHRKPSAEAFEGALAAVGCSPDEVVFVDDSRTNVEAAQALGIPSIRFESEPLLRTALKDFITW